MCVLCIPCGLRCRVATPVSRSPFLTSLQEHAKFFPCHTSRISPVTPLFATDPKTASRKSFACHTCETPPGGGGPMTNRGSLPGPYSRFSIFGFPISLRVRRAPSLRAIRRFPSTLLRRRWESPHSNSFSVSAISRSRSSTRANTVPASNFPSPSLFPAVTSVRISIPSSTFATGQT